MAVTLTVYSGSSLYPQDMTRLLDAAVAAGINLVFRPPIIRGDLLAAPASDGWNHRVLILDGQFGQDMAVSVTEVREYLERGSYLAGASSMGALRAVECRVLGMVRYGWVAEQYRNGSIESDAEVALLMDPLTSEALTIPLVNVRWLLRELEGEGRLTARENGEILAVARRVHYRARTPEILAGAFERNLKASSSQLITGFLEPGEMAAWDRKRLDGISAVESEIRAIARFPAAG